MKLIIKRHKYYWEEVTSAVDEAISRVAHIANAEVAPNSVVTVRIRLAHRQVETTLIDIYIDDSVQSSLWSKYT